MPIRDCTVVAIEGTQAAGKTTLVHALTAYFREQGVNVACTGEPARVSPFMEEIVLHRKGEFDLVAELDLFAAQFTTPMRDARNHRLLITDKTPANVLAYARLVLDQEDPQIRAVLRSMESLCRSWMPLAYDAVVHCRDHFDQQAGGDRFREKVLTLQGAAETAVYEAISDTGVPVLDLPPGLTTQARVEWIAKHLYEAGIRVH
ncbi:AAA family ATPase [Streptomyces cinnamoneus]|uniref:AAA family ATPase n=1 Tax=Streptomyces cinnamoneus TaxID=53446 RepID=UPI000CEF3847|nr:AAA family ATPase [Streptomyces cinnamoneus]PPT14777.1 thymidylate kinase [Streptomyces cinnamoneus]